MSRQCAVNLSEFAESLQLNQQRARQLRDGWIESSVAKFSLVLFVKQHLGRTIRIATGLAV
jgi:hypothetical protein